MAYTYGSVTKCKVGNGTTRNEYECRLGYQVNSQSIENNTSNVTLRLEVRSISSSYATYGYNQTTKIDGTSLSAASFDMRSTNTWQVFGTRTITITHNADGTYSASKSGSFTTTASGNYSLKSGSASVTVKPATIARASTPTLSSSSVTMGSSVTINTNRASSSFTHTLKYSFGNTSGTIATGVGASYSWTPPTSLASQITNKLNGTCTITCETYNGSTLLGTKTVTMTLSVPSASVPTLSATSLEMGKSLTVTTNRKADNFTHNITYSFGNTSGTISSSAGTSASWSTSIDLAKQTPNATSGTCTITCKTYNGTALVGTQTKTLTLTVPTSIVPSISNVSVSEAGSLVPSSWGVYVQGKSKLKVTVTASGSYSSTITTYKTTGIDSNTYWASSFTSSLLQTTGTKTITAKVVDSRSREATKTAQYTCIEYSNPSISIAEVTRCNSDGTDNEEGEYVKYSFKADISPVSNKNTYSYKLGYKKSEDDYYSYITISNSSYSINKENVVISDVTFSVDNSYDFEFVVNDYFTETTIPKQLGTGFTLLDFNDSGKGMSIGKASEKEDALEINMDIYNKDGAVLEAIKVDNEAPTNKEIVWIQQSKNLAQVFQTTKTDGSVTFTPVSKSELQINGTAQWNIYMHIIPSLFLKANRTYSLSINYDASGEFFIYTNKAENVGLGYSNFYLGGGRKIRFTPTKDGEIDLVLYINKNLTVNHNLQIQVEEGATPTEYEPYIDKKIYCKNASGNYDEFVNIETMGIQTINNSNGTAIKYPDGTLICMNKIENQSYVITNGWGAIFETASTSTAGSTTFPVAFISKPVLNATQIGNLSGGMLNDVYYDNTKITRVNFRRPTSATSTLSYSYMAIGRWK